MAEVAHDLGEKGGGQRRGEKGGGRGGREQREMKENRERERERGREGVTEIEDKKQKVRKCTQERNDAPNIQQTLIARQQGKVQP
jgi:hypothetical protein